MFIIPFSKAQAAENAFSGLCYGIELGKSDRDSKTANTKSITLLTFISYCDIIHDDKVIIIIIYP